jgi:hypothetical protein
LIINSINVLDEMLEGKGHEEVEYAKANGVYGIAGLLPRRPVSAPTPDGGADF